eukprot:CAMPEP_0203775284 /NCGR_PEP_ID=MMETSP0099_2-20121227/5965_1 /ASSEMBLY_ACC=CAM_ASM_000209 /TAXON_ID=96639 /ORGANISM=" , Strain NY0313808BC1" /LENGTH=492 /DNA_ID=CAMNT_0050673883 /DNA_START=110 /DNA_END=1588 /DNA_ORIENTATION=+
MASAKVKDVELSDLSLGDVRQPGRVHGLSPSSESGEELVRSGSDSLVVDDDHEVRPGNSGRLGASFNFINSIVGAGIIGLPFAVRECGFFMGLFMLLFVAVLTYSSVNLLIDSGIKVKRRSYEGLAEFCFGKAGFIIVSVFMLVFAFGAMCSYMVIIGDTVPVVINRYTGGNISRQLVIFLVGTFIILPLCLLRDMAMLSNTSSISVLADVVIVFLVLIRAAPSKDAWPGDAIEPEFAFVNSSFFGGVGAISFAYVCQHSSFIVFNTLQVPTKRNWRVVNCFSIATALVLSLMLALGGYLTFYDQTRANVLNNFDCGDDAINAARVLLALTMILTYPMEQFVARHSCYAMFFSVSPEPTGLYAMPLSWHLGITLTLWTLSLIVGLTVTDLGFILELTGALGASFLGYILPPMMYFKVNSLKRVWQRSIDVFKPGTPDYSACRKTQFNGCMLFWAPALMWFFGIIAMVAGTGNSIMMLLGESNNDHECVVYKS